MKNKFFLYISYCFYLLLLGQSCSGLGKRSEQFVSLKIPSIQSPQINFNLFKTANNERRAPSSFKKINKRKFAKRSYFRNKKKWLQPPLLKKEIRIVREGKKGNKKNIFKRKVEIKKIKISNSIKRFISYKTGIEHYGFKAPTLRLTNLAYEYESYLTKTFQKLASISSQNFKERKKSRIKEEEEKLIAFEKMNENMVEEFEKEVLTDSVTKKEASVLKQEAEDLVFIDYSKKGSGVRKNGTPNLHLLAQSNISSRVSEVIRREMKGDSLKTKKRSKNKRHYKELLASRSFSALKEGQSRVNSQFTLKSKGNEYNSRVTIHALNAVLGKGILGSLRNFSFYPSVDNNEIYEDLNEGKINYDYSLNSDNGILRATIHKSLYVRTTLEIPLSDDYSDIEIPLIENKSFQSYLDRHNLSGYGGSYLVDLGEFIDDVEISSDANQKNSYEYRIYLNEDFKEVKSSGRARYILFVGVIPGNIRVQYLGLNRQETSKITFVAPDEMTFDVAEMSPSYEIEYDLFLRHTLGKKNQIYDLETSKMMTYIGGVTPEKTALGKYKFQKKWSIKGARSYIEINHLESPVFVGIDGDSAIELPSMEFISEIFNSFNISKLHSNECLVQFNFPKKEVADIKIIAESANGPSSFEQYFLDNDGIFSRYLSPKTEKLFILGNEEGIFPIEIIYGDGTKDHLRTYCSHGSYLLEQF